MSDDLISLPRHELRSVLHDLNNMLAALSGAAGFLAKKLDAQEELRARVDHIARCVERGSQIAARIDRLTSKT